VNYATTFRKLDVIVLLVHSGTSGGARVPTLWLVLGPLGQSITAAGALGTVGFTYWVASV